MRKRNCIFFGKNMEDHNNILESNGSEENGSNQDQKLESAKREMGEARKENEKLKLSLARVVKDYQTMHMHFFDIIQQDSQEEVTKAVGKIDSHEESELVSLSLGISSKGQPSMDEKRNSNRTKMIKEDENLTLSLGLNTTFDPPGAGEGKELEDLTEKWPPSKVLKTARTGDISEASQHTQLKKTRVCIRARCDTQTMNDGCQWRKYGQKMAKGNPCPRGYYRCTVSPSCPVKKQVQRCAEDTSILITTYEGTHNHPLPTSATAIAYTTSAAASMIQSPSLSSQQLGLANSDTFPITNSNVAYNLNPQNHTSTYCQQFSRPQQLHFHNSSISSSNSHPTVILDLTAPQTSFHIGKFTPAFSYTPPKYPSTNLNFSSTITPVQSSMLHSTWSPCSGHFNYGGLITQSRNQYDSLMNNGKQPFQGHFYQPNYMSNHAISQQPLTDSTEATTKAITTNPKVQSTIAAALTTYVGNGAACGGVMENHVVAESAALNLKLGGDMPYKENTVYTTSSQNGIGCASSRNLSMSSNASNTQRGNMFKSSTASNAKKGNMFKFPPSQSSKSSFGSPSNISNQLLGEKK